MPRSFPLVILLLLAAFPSPARAMTDAEVRQAIQEVINLPQAKEPLDWWRSLGPDTPSIIISLYNADPVLTHRLHLLRGLGAFNDATSANFLEQQASDTQDSVVRNQAIRSVGASQGAAGADFVAKYLNSPDAQTRLAAGETLRGINDPHAQEIYQNYLSQEKAPWLVAKLKGESLPKPLSLAPVTSSEDRIDPEFAGTWRGYWIEPKPDSTQGMRSEPVIVHLRVSGASEAGGDAILKVKDRVRSFAFAKVIGKGGKISGNLVEEPVSRPAPGASGTPSPPPAPAFETELLRGEAGGPQLRVRIPKTGATLILRKDP